jgi:6-pyruvoyltetrahydropterin/6-carboxytetrahydropterin synthase
VQSVATLDIIHGRGVPHFFVNQALLTAVIVSMNERLRPDLTVPARRPMYRVKQVIDFCYGHRLLQYEGKCKNLHGHNGRVEIILEAPTLDSRGMLVDFVDIKRYLRTWIDTELDHKLILCASDPLLPVLRKHGQPVFEMVDNPTAENIARVIYEQGMRSGLPIARVALWETPNSCAIYSPVPVSDGEFPEVISAEGCGHGEWSGSGLARGD